MNRLDSRLDPRMVRAARQAVAATVAEYGGQKGIAALVAVHATEGDTYFIADEAGMRASAVKIAADPCPPAGLLAVAVVTVDGELTPYYPAVN